MFFVSKTSIENLECFLWQIMFQLLIQLNYLLNKYLKEIWQRISLECFEQDLKS